MTKRLLSVLLAQAVLAAAVINFAGCTTKPDPSTVAAEAAILRIAVKQGTVYALTQKPNSRAYFTGASQSINLMLANSNYSAVALSNALATVSIKEIRDNPLVQTVIMDVNTIYGATYASILSKKMDGVTYLKPALQAVTDGMTDALAIVPVK